MPRRLRDGAGPPQQDPEGPGRSRGVSPCHSSTFSEWDPFLKPGVVCEARMLCPRAPTKDEEGTKPFWPKGVATCRRRVLESQASEKTRPAPARTHLWRGLRSLPRSPWPLRSLVGWAGKHWLASLRLLWLPPLLLPPPPRWPAAERASPGKPAAASAPRRASPRRSGTGTLWDGRQRRCHPAEKARAQPSAGGSRHGTLHCRRTGTEGRACRRPRQGQRHLQRAACAGVRCE